MGSLQYIGNTIKEARYDSIKKFPHCGYSVELPWISLEDKLKRLDKDQKELGYRLVLEPDFQRGHIWNKQQKIQYIEYVLRCNGRNESGLDIYFNNPGWEDDWKGDIVLVDGLQRLTAARDFMGDKIPAFGWYYSEYNGKLPLLCILDLIWLN
jgi:hypothetical protein